MVEELGKGRGVQGRGGEEEIKAAQHLLFASAAPALPSPLLTPAACTERSQSVTQCTFLPICFGGMPRLGLRNEARCILFQRFFCLLDRDACVFFHNCSELSCKQFRVSEAARKRLRDENVHHCLSADSLQKAYDVKEPSWNSTRTNRRCHMCVESRRSISAGQGEKNWRVQRFRLKCKHLCSELTERAQQDTLTVD